MKKSIITILIVLSALFILSCESEPENAADGTTAAGIEIVIDDIIMADDGGYNFGDVELFNTRSIIGTISNTGTAALNLTDSISISGTDSSLFSVTSQPDTVIAAGDSSAFAIILSTSVDGVGLKTADLNIASNAADEPNLSISLNAEAVDRVWKIKASEPGWLGRTHLNSVVFDNKIWVIGGEKNLSFDGLADVWYSSDGRTWTEAVSVAEWCESNELIQFECVVFKDKIWLMGGYLHDLYEDNTDIWCSEDGITWSKVSTNIVFGCDFDPVVYDDKIWIFGPFHSWYSSDGTSWTEVAKTNFEISRFEVFDDKLWGIGCDSSVWYSEDGFSWTQATSDAGWKETENIQTAVCNGKMWMLGDCDVNYPYKYNSQWYSEDGVTWINATESSFGSCEIRYDFESVVWNNRIWVLGGRPISYGSVMDDVEYFYDEVLCW